MLEFCPCGEVNMLKLAYGSGAETDGGEAYGCTGCD